MHRDACHRGYPSEDLAGRDTCHIDARERCLHSYSVRGERMKTISGAGRPSTEKHTIAQEELSRLLQFFSAAGEGLSFYFGSPEVHNNAHRDEAIAAKYLLQSVSHSASGELPGGVATDLEKMKQKVERVRSEPNKLHVVFACSGEGVWREFDVPCSSSQNTIELGQYLRVVPLVSALQRTRSYGVVLVETGRARAFLVRGTESEELVDAIDSADLSLHADDARVGWSDHIVRDQREHERTFFKHVAEQIQELAEANRLETLIVGCREELWADLGRLLDKFGRIKTATFHLPSFSMGGAEVVRYAEPVFLSLERKKIEDALDSVNENLASSAVGVGDVLALLSQGNVRKVVLGTMGSEVASECRACGYVGAGRSSSCAICGGTYIGHLPVDEAVLRRSLACGAEVLNAEAAGVSFNGVAALLRY